MKASKFQAGDRIVFRFREQRYQGVVLKENRSTGRRGFYFITLDALPMQHEVFEDFILPVAEPNDILKDLLC